ncbi:hypothetical protein JOD24_003222 [Kroppenstedtia sanguinis]
MRFLQEIVTVPPSPSPQAVFYDGGQWEERKGRFVPIIHLMVNPALQFDLRGKKKEQI